MSAVAPVSAPVARFAPSKAPLSKRGDAGPVVRSMQEQLSKLGFLLHTPDGKFGAQSEQDLQAFQLAVGLKPTGLWDASTRKAMARELAEHPLMPKLLPTRLNRGERRLAAFAYRALLAQPRPLASAPKLVAPRTVRIDALLGGSKDVVVDQGHAWLKQTVVVPGLPSTWTELGALPAALAAELENRADSFVAAKV